MMSGNGNFKPFPTNHARPCSVVGNMSDYRCVSDCRSRGREFHLDPVSYFFEIDHEIISTGTLLFSADSFKKGCCQLQVKDVHKVLANGLFKLAQEK